MKILAAESTSFFPQGWPEWNVLGSQMFMGDSQKRMNYLFRCEPHLICRRLPFWVVFTYNETILFEQKETFVTCSG